MFNIVEVVSRNRFSFFANRGASHNTVLVFFALDGFFTKSHKIGANCRTSGNRKTPQRKNDPRKKQGFTSLSDHRSLIFWILVNRIKVSKTNKKTNTPLNFKDERFLALISFPSDLHGERLFVSSEENVCSWSLPRIFKCSQNLCLNHVQIRSKVHSPYPCLKQVPDLILKLKD